MLSDNFLISISIRVKIKHPFTGELLPYEIIICNSFHNNRNFPAKDKNSLVHQRELFFFRPARPLERDNFQRGYVFTFTI
jgi:hypothetical protein